MLHWKLCRWTDRYITDRNFLTLLMIDEAGSRTSYKCQCSEKRLKIRRNWLRKLEQKWCSEIAELCWLFSFRDKEKELTTQLDVMKKSKSVWKIIAKRLMQKKLLMWYLWCRYNGTEDGAGWRYKINMKEDYKSKVIAQDAAIEKLVNYFA